MDISLLHARLLTVSRKKIVEAIYVSFRNVSLNGFKFATYEHIATKHECI